MCLTEVHSVHKVELLRHHIDRMDYGLRWLLVGQPTHITNTGSINITDTRAMPKNKECLAIKKSKTSSNNCAAAR